MLGELAQAAKTSLMTDKFSRATKTMIKEFDVGVVKLSNNLKFVGRRRLHKLHIQVVLKFCEVLGEKLEPFGAELFKGKIRPVWFGAHDLSLRILVPLGVTSRNVHTLLSILVPKRTWPISRAKVP